jgi:hypothetical protein
LADKVALGTGNWSTAGTWGVVDTTSKLVSTSTSTTALTTGTLDSATFTPGAITVIGVCVKLGSRASGTPTNTITITLRNSTDSVNVVSVTANVSDLPNSVSADFDGGWHFFKFSASQLLVAGKAYLIRATLSSTSTTVSLRTNGTANNWQRLLVTSTTAAPAAGDDLFLAGILDGAANPATATSITVTMDSTAATDYGSANTSVHVPALSVSKRCTLQYGTTAATNYVLRLSGHLVVFRDGVVNIGTVATPIPRGGTAVLEFDCAADADFGYQGQNGSTNVWQALSRTSGKNVSWTLLTADQSAGATSATIADDCGWLTGDEVAIASTTRTRSDTEVVTLSGDAGASSLAHGATSAAHLGTTASKHQAEVLLLTRSIIIRSVGTTNLGYVTMAAAANLDADWVSLKNLGGTTAGSAPWGIRLETTTGVVTLNHCIVRDNEGSGYHQSGTVSSGTFSLDYCCTYNCTGSATLTVDAMKLTSNNMDLSANGGTYTITNCVLLGDTGSGTSSQGGLDMSGTFLLGSTTTTAPTISNIRIAACGDGLALGALNDARGWTLGPFVIHSCNGTGILFNGNVSNLRFAGETYIWRNAGAGIADSGSGTLLDIRFGGPLVLVGNASANIWPGGTNLWGHVRFSDLRLYGDTAFSTTYGILNSAVCLGWRIDKLTTGSSGLLTTHTTNDFFGQGTGNWCFECVVSYAAAALSISSALTGSTVRYPSRILVERNGGAGVHLARGSLGSIDIETGTVDVTPGMKLTPSNAGALMTGHEYQRLDTAYGLRGRGYMVGVESGGAVTVSVQVRKDGSYTGSAPRLIVKANPAIGIDADAVLDTLSVGANTWETLTGTTATVTDDGVLEFVVDCDGSAGSIYVDSWSQTGGASSPSSMEVWVDGLPFDSEGGGGGSGGGSAVPRMSVSVSF